jgi:hydroxymethylpyrimidine pyrophosphatase-like HAD family hydrolase
LTLEQVVAFGDADNDIEMLRMAGRGICMAQGTEEAKSAASSHVSAYTNDENAVAREINALLFA